MPRMLPSASTTDTVTWAWLSSGRRICARAANAIFSALTIIVVTSFAVIPPLAVVGKRLSIGGNRGLPASS